MTANALTNRFGGASNYAEVESNGNLALYGTAKAWDDLRIEPVARTTGSNTPAFEKWMDDTAGTSRGVYLYSFDNAIANSEKEIFFTMQMPHSWDGGAIDIHVHWIADTTAASSKVRLGLEYAWANIGAVYGDSTIIYADTEIGDPAPTGTTARKHTITAFAALTPSASQNGLSSIVVGRLFRNSSATEDSYTGKVGLLYIDAHFQINSLGSDEEYVK